MTTWPENEATTPEAKLSAYYKDGSGTLRQLDAYIAIDREGVTEEDVQRLHHSAYIHLDSEDKSFVEPVLVSSKGGKA
jgi:hypothetical protein